MSRALEELEGRVRDISARLATLRQQNQRLEAKVARLERDLEAASEGGEGVGGDERRELEQRLRALVRGLERLLED